MTSFPRHAKLAENPCRPDIPRVTGRIDAVQLEIIEPSRKQFLAYRRSDAMSPDPRMHDIGDLALPLPSVPDVQLTHADYVALHARCISEPLLR